MKKLLFGVLLIAMVASMIGAGTWAYFTDIEMSYGNLFTAGSLDLKIDGNDDPITIPWDPGELDCLAPCDEGFAEVTYSNEGCVAGYPDITFMITLNAENGMPEPEIDFPDTTWGPDGGELCQNLLITVRVDHDGVPGWDPSPPIQGATLSSLDNVRYYVSDNKIEGDDVDPGNSTMPLRIEWLLPCAVGNDIMTDLCKFDVEFSLHQEKEAEFFHDLEVDQTASCCSVFVTGQGNVVAGTNATFAHIAEGTNLQVSASDADACCNFVDWTGDVNDPNVRTTSVEMDASKTITANCVTASYDLTVDQSQSCCSVNVGAPVNDTVDAYTTDTFNVPCVDGSTAAVVSLDANDGSGCAFDDWSGDTADDLQSTTVEMDEDQTVTANCITSTYALTVISDGCCPINVSGDATGTVPADDQQTFPGLNYNDVVTVAADGSDPCCVFASWDDGGAQSHPITIIGSDTVTATCNWLDSNLTVDQTASCCDVNVGAPVSSTVLAGTSATFNDIDCCTTVSFTAVNPDQVCCTFVDWSGVDSSAGQNADVHMDGTDKTVTANCDAVADADLTVNSCGCCPVEVAGVPGGPITVPAGGTQTFNDLPCCTDVTVTAQTPYLCSCVDIDVDSVAAGCPCETPAENCPSVQVHMDGSDHVVDVCCQETVIDVPEPCCWCIYASEWWAMPAQPPDPPEYTEYFCLHTVEWLPPGHCELLPMGTYTIADPTYHQEFVGYAGAPPNGYGVPEWHPLNVKIPPMPKAGACRYNSVLGIVYATGMAYWNSQIDLLNYKTRFDVTTTLGPIVLYSLVVMYQPVAGNMGWPYNVGNAWLSLGYSSITMPSWSYTEISGMEVSTCSPLYPGGINCYVVDAYSWGDADGIDDDGDGAFDEDPGGPMGNGMDDDADGLIDEDGGDGVFDPVNQRNELTISSTTWWSQDYGCSIEKWTYPGALYYGFEHLCLIWQCFDPPYPVVVPPIPPYDPCP